MPPACPCWPDRPRAPRWATLWCRPGRPERSAVDARGCERWPRAAPPQGGTCRTRPSGRLGAPSTPSAPSLPSLRPLPTPPRIETMHSSPVTSSRAPGYRSAAGTIEHWGSNRQPGRCKPAAADATQGSASAAAAGARATQGRTSMPHYCFTTRVREDALGEYKAAPAAVWPEMLAALRDAGWRNYRLYLSPDGLLVGHFEADDYDAAQAAMARTAVNAQWQAHMEQFFADPGNQIGRAHVLQEVFHLESQLDAAELPRSSS